MNRIGLWVGIAVTVVAVVAAFVIGFVVGDTRVQPRDTIAQGAHLVIVEKPATGDCPTEYPYEFVPLTRDRVVDEAPVLCSSEPVPDRLRQDKEHPEEPL